MLSFLNSANRLTDLFPQVRPLERGQRISNISGHELLFYPSQNQALKQNPIFMIPSLISLSYVLDLLPGKSFIEHLNLKGVDVYLLNWGYPKKHDQHINFESLLTKRIPFFLESAKKHQKQIHRISRTTSKIPFHLFGHCLGGTLASLYASQEKNKNQFLSLTLMTSPLDLSHMGKFKFWIQNSPLKYEKVQESFGNIPWPLLHSTFMSMKPLAQYQRLKRFFTTKMNAEQRLNYFALELWSHDSVAFRGKTYLTLINNVLKNKNLLHENFELENGQEISIQNLTLPVLNLASKEDHIVPYASPVKSADQLPLCQDFTHIDFSGGHVGCLVSKKTQEHLWPQISTWLERHNHDV